MSPTALISNNNPESISHQLRLELLRQIQGGKLRAGNRIPSERELAEQYRISRASVREAIAQLLIEGVLTRGGGRGTYVSQRTSAPSRESVNHQIAFWISERIFFFVQAGYARILAGASEACHECGYGLQFLALDDRKLKDLLERGPLSKQFDGSILAGGLSRDLAAEIGKQALPLISVDLLTGAAGAESIHIEYETGMRAAVDHLVSLGHTNIGFIGFAHSQKYESYWKSLDDCRLAYRPRFVEFLEQSDLSPGTVAGFDAMQTILSRPPLPTAIVVTNDEVAVGAIEALKIAQLSVPAEMSIVGFDDLVAGPLPLTTVKVDLVEVGRIAGQTLLRWIETGDRPASPIKVPVDLMLRSSTAAPRSG
ncbi:MAG: GntR family transcriptional regulator [Verrucomicrobia bacterium]|nr:GntR family transcriptional regulator [Verrucomicrobiota bacterium]